MTSRLDPCSVCGGRLRAKGSVGAAAVCTACAPRAVVNLRQTPFGAWSLWLSVAGGGSAWTDRMRVLTAEERDALVALRRQELAAIGAG